MTDTRRLLRAILEITSIPDQAAEMFEVCEYTKKSLAKHDKQIAEEKEAFVAKVQEIERKKAILQMNCKHYISTYHGDAAGGSSSVTVCDICGSEL